MPNTSPNLIFVGPSYANVVPAKDPGPAFTAYLGGESPWAAIAAIDRIRRAKQSKAIKQQAAGKEEPARALQKKPAPLVAAHLKGRVYRARNFADADEAYPAPTSTDITGVTVTLLTTLGPERTDLPSKTSYDLLRECGIDIVSSSSRMPVDVYKVRTIHNDNLDTMLSRTDKRPFNTDTASSELTSQITPQTIVVINGRMPGNKRASQEFFRIADLTHQQGGLVFVDLQAPMDPKTASEWAKKADIVKISYEDSKKLAKTKTDGDAAVKFLKDGAKLVVITKGAHGASAWWQQTTATHKVDEKTSTSSVTNVTTAVHQTLPIKGSYASKIKFKGGAAFNAHFALSLIKYGANANNLKNMLTTKGFMTHVGEDTVSNTTKFLKVADKLVQSGPHRRPSVSRPIASGETPQAITNMIYANG